MPNTMNLLAPSDCHSSSELCEGDVSKSLIQTATEHQADLHAQAIERQANSLLKFAMLAKQDICQEHGMTIEEVHQKLRGARK